MLEQVIKQYCDMKAMLSAVTKEELSREFIRILKIYPQLSSLGWVQYAPHFNDGEPCEFSVHSLCYDLKEEYKNPSEEEEDRWYAYNEVSWRQEETSGMPELQKLADVFSSIPEEIMKDLFGYDSRVVITRAGIEVEDYSCEHD